MANTVGSITDWMPIVCSDNPTLGFCSSRQAYLYILYSLKPPFELPTYNNRSGVIRECGVELHFEHVNCIPQNEPLASTCRSFTLPSSPDGPSIWYYFPDSCEREPATWTSPVFTFSYGPEASLAARLSLGHNWVEAMPPLNYYGIHWDLDLCDPNDLPVPGSQLILAPLAATYLIKWRISIVNGPWPGQFNFAILGSSPFRTVHETIGPSLPAGAPWESTIIGNFLLNGPETVIFAIQKNTDLVVGFDVHPGTTLDAYLDAQAPLNNYGADSWLYFGVSFLGGTKLYRWRSIINFDLSGLIGRTLTDASLTAYSQIGAGGSVPATFYRLTPPGTVTEYGVTWNKYDGVNNWLAPGGDWHPPLPPPLPSPFTRPPRPA